MAKAKLHKRPIFPEERAGADELGLVLISAFAELIVGRETIYELTNKLAEKASDRGATDVFEVEYIQSQKDTLVYGDAYKITEPDQKPNPNPKP